MIQFREADDKWIWFSRKEKSIRTDTFSPFLDFLANRCIVLFSRTIWSYRSCINWVLHFPTPVFVDVDLVFRRSRQNPKRFTSKNFTSFFVGFSRCVCCKRLSCGTLVYGSISSSSRGFSRINGSVSTAVPVILRTSLSILESSL